MRQGQLLAYLRPSLSAGERASQQAELAELHRPPRRRASCAAGNLRETVAARDIDAQRAEAASLRQRRRRLAQPVGDWPARLPAACSARPMR